MVFGRLPAVSVILDLWAMPRSALTWAPVAQCPAPEVRRHAHTGGRLRVVMRIRSASGRIRHSGAALGVPGELRHPGWLLLLDRCVQRG
jgi:hypothetical protein